MFVQILYWIFLLCVSPILLVSTILTASVTIVLSAMGLGRWAGYVFPRLWAKLFCILTLVKVTVKGRENVEKNTSYVFVCNHQGAYDIFDVYGYSCKVSGHIMVDNSSPSATRLTMEKAERQLRGGMSLVVFPEGARTWNGKMRPFKRGAYMLAVEFGLPVVPITIDGSFDVMPRFKKLPHWGHIVLTIHKPIEAVAGKHDLAAVMEESYRVIHESLPERQK